MPVVRSIAYILTAVNLVRATRPKQAPDSGRPAALSPPDREYIEVLRAHGAELFSVQREQLLNFDKAILHVNGGALGITIAFADKFGVEEHKVTLLLLSSWGLFTLGIMANIYSNLVASHDTQKEIDKVNASIQAGGADLAPGNPWRRLTQPLNYFALGAFFVGVLLFGLHAYVSTQQQTVERAEQNDRQASGPGSGPH